MRLANSTSADLTKDERDALLQFATLGISVADFLRRMMRIISVGKFVAGEREITVKPLPSISRHVTRDDIRWVVQRYLRGRISGEELSHWAGLLLAISAYELPCNDDDDDILALLHDLALPLKDEYLDRDVLKKRIEAM
jgi:hypothetical protein